MDDVVRNIAMWNSAGGCQAACFSMFEDDGTLGCQQDDIGSKEICGQEMSFKSVQECWEHSKRKGIRGKSCNTTVISIVLCCRRI